MKANNEKLTKEEYESLFENKDFDKLFKELKNKVKEKKLNDKIPIRGTIEIIIVLSLFFTSIYSIFNFHYLLSSILIILTLLRTTYLAHDLIHLQYYKNRTLNKNLGYIFGNIILGLSRNWWERDHNVNHHTWTNSEKVDEDIKALNGMFLKNKNNKNKIKFIHKYKKITFYIAIFFIWFSFHYQSWKYIIKDKFETIDIITLLFHYLIIGLIFLNYTIIESLILLTIVYFIYGFIASMVFITNHIGMEVIEGDLYKNMPWFELQTRTSRNIKGNKFIHWLYGGLNTQIEHHLFPKIPRLNLLKVKKITEDFCKEKGLFYHNVSALKAYKEINDTLNNKGKAYLN